jgi:hypothetical protein
MKLVEVEGSHTMRSTYSFLDVLVSPDRTGYDYALVLSTRFTSRIISTRPSKSTVRSTRPGPPGAT